MNTDSKAEWKMARVVQAIQGKFSKWKVGDRVKARRMGRKLYLIERVKWRSPLVPLTNQCGGVPADCLEFGQD